jgi:hypothetical protein
MTTEAQKAPKIDGMYDIVPTIVRLWFEPSVSTIACSGTSSVEYTTFIPS